MLTDKSLHFQTPLPGPTVGPSTRSFIDRFPQTRLFQDLRWSYPFDPQTLLSLPLLPTFLPHTAFFPGRSEWLRDSSKLLPSQGSPARVGVALPCSRRRHVCDVSSSKITNKFIFSHGPNILIFPLQYEYEYSNYSCQLA